MPDLQELLVALIVAAAAVYAAHRLGLIPRRHKGVTTVVRVSELRRRPRSGPPPRA